ncbi:Ger(x)C family spore germination protein [Bacillus sp. T3]|uniref:Ger(x)C family spore germination protein n=1 Tax=Bacillus sp. T3 TaxID=467262 RepID=UPI002982430A|nr:Ger(x)C family spore germination protein [Bacillus sp. T3]
MAAARTKMQEKIARTLFWGHADATVFGEKMAKKGIREHLDFFARTLDARLRNKVFVCEGEAKDFLPSVPHLEDSASDTLNELSQFQISMDVTMSQLMQMMSNETGGALLPYVKTETSKGKGKMKGKTQLALNGVAVFEEDKMIERLDDSLTRGILWVRDEVDFATITADVDDENGKITSFLIRSHTKLIPNIKNGKWSITIQCKTEDDLVQNASTLDIRKSETIQMIEKKLEERLETRIKQTVERVQQDLQVDVLKFNRAFQRKYPKAWKQAKADWKDIYPDIEVSYDITVKVLRPGLSTEPTAVPDKEVKGK